MKIQLGVFFGGKSVEHEVSIITAVQAMNSLSREKYDIIPIYIAKTGEMYTGEDVGKIEAYRDIPALLRRSRRIVLLGVGGKVQMIGFPLKKLGNSVLGTLDVAFPMGHGTNVEDGCLQGFLQTLGLPYVGCDVMSAAAGMNKYVMKLLLEAEGIPVLDGVRVRVREFSTGQERALARLEEAFSYPIIIKPISLGSSVGIKVAHDRAGLVEALEYAFMFSNEILAERAIKSLREINVAVLGDSGEAEASECEEPVSHDEILTYSEKYSSGKSGGKGGGMASLSRIIPARLQPELRETIRETAVKAFQALGCCGVARIDFMIDEDSDTLYLNEINTLPGSLAFYLWEPVGVKYGELLERMIALAFKRERELKAVNFSFETNILSGVRLGGAKGSKN